MKQPNSIVILSLLIATLASCVRNDKWDNISIKQPDASYAIPLVHSRATLDELVEKADQTYSLIIYPDDRLSFYYSGDILTKTANEIFDSVAGGIPIPVTKPHDTILVPTNILIEEAHLIGDSMFFGFRSNRTDTVDVTLTIPNMVKDGKSMSVNTTLIHTGELPVEGEAAIDLNGYDMTLENNSFEVLYDARLRDGTKITLDQVFAGFNYMKFTFIKGYFTKDNYDVPRDTIDISVYTRPLQGDLYFEDPSITITISNSFGFPVRTDLVVMKVIGKDGTHIDLEGEQLTEGIDISYPRLNEIGQTKYDKFYFDKHNSNIDEAFNSKPVQLIYDIDGVGNPDENEDIIGFLEDTSQFSINVAVELPAHGWTHQFEIDDTFDINFDPIEDIDTAEIKIIVENGFPLSTDLQVYFLKENTVIDSLFNNKPLQIEGADVDGAGKAIDSKRIEHKEIVDHGKLDHLTDADRMVIRFLLSTTEAPDRSIHILASNFITVKMGAIINLSD